MIKIDAKYVLSGPWDDEKQTEFNEINICTGLKKCVHIPTVDENSIFKKQNDMRLQDY